MDSYLLSRQTIKQGYKDYDATDFCPRWTQSHSAFSFSSTMACLASSDIAFGPQIATQCRTFDFTLLFEDIVFSCVPAGLLLLMLSTQIILLLRRPKARLRVPGSIAYQAVRKNHGRPLCSGLLTMTEHMGSLRHAGGCLEPSRPRCPVHDAGNPGRRLPHALGHRLGWHVGTP